MAVEDHPKFPEWKEKLETMLSAHVALKSGKGTQRDFDNAVEQYRRIADEL